jgi:alkanesulfonate monooxygenase SsuD/methylene tetrahydromethanopterin reductase-like flavin-dependent oxidoreductase (luciferase family)
VLVPLHNPMHLAKQAATLQELSSGRLRLGIGMG